MASREILACGKEEGTQLWEVQKYPYFLAWLEPVEETEYGRFHEAYTYVMLKTVEGKASDKSYALDLWIGRDSEPELRKDARDATKQIRKKLGVPELEFGVHRQGRESDEFKANFPTGIRYCSFDKEQQEKYDRRYKKEQE